MSSLLGPIGDRNRLADAVHERLRAAIFAGRIPPGSRLSIPALAARLGVSRSPVREAVLRLVSEGLAVDEPHKGVALIVLDAGQLIPVYEVRAVLEGLAARLAAARVGTGGAAASPAVGSPDTRPTAPLATAVRLHAAAVEDRDLTAAREADLLFHRATRELAGNEQLTGFLEQIQDKVRLAMATTLVTPGPALALADHRAILDAIAAGDPDLAAATAETHVRRLRDALAAAGGGTAGTCHDPGHAAATDW